MDLDGGIPGRLDRLGQFQGPIDRLDVVLCGSASLFLVGLIVLAVVCWHYSTITAQ